MNINTSTDPTEHKFPLIVISLTIVVITLVAIIIVLLFFRGDSSGGTNNNTSSSSAISRTTSNQITSASVAAFPNWQFDGSVWKAMSTAPKCTEPFVFDAPVDVNEVESILYPGQTRGGDYKSHGGFKFANSHSNDVSVKAPFDAYLVKGSRYIEAGETQYFLVFISNCGIMYRFDHLNTLSPKLMSLVDSTLPAAKPDDSRTTDFNPPVLIRAGEEVATAVGYKNSKNVSFDFGVNDLRQKNTVSNDATWVAAHPQPEYAHYGVCWLDLLTEPDKSVVKGLPATDQTNGKSSDYCG